MTHAQMVRLGDIAARTFQRALKEQPRGAIQAAVDLPAQGLQHLYVDIGAEVVANVVVLPDNFKDAVVRTRACAEALATRVKTPVRFYRMHCPPGCFIKNFRCGRTTVRLAMDYYIYADRLRGRMDVCYQEK